METLRHGHADSSESLMFACLCLDLVLPGVSSVSRMVGVRARTAIGFDRVRMTSEESLRVSDMMGERDAWRGN